MSCQPPSPPRPPPQLWGFHSHRKDIECKHPAPYMEGAKSRERQLPRRIRWPQTNTSNMLQARYSSPWAYVTLCWAVQVTKKTTQERMPSLDRYSDRSKADDASHSVVYDRAYRRGEGEEEDIPPENLAKAFKVRPGFRV